MQTNNKSKCQKELKINKNLMATTFPTCFKNRWELIDSSGAVHKLSLC